MCDYYYPCRKLKVLQLPCIVLDTVKLEARLLEEKLQKLRAVWLDCIEAKKKHEILSLVGSLQHTTKVVCHGRAFVSQMYFTTRLNVEFRSDLRWWYTFLADWNGISLLRWDDKDWSPDYLIETDTSKAWSCRALWQGHWWNRPLTILW